MRMICSYLLPVYLLSHFDERNRFSKHSGKLRRRLTSS